MHLSFVILLILLERTLARCPSELVIEPCKCSESAGTSFVSCKNFENFDDLQKVFDESLDYSFDKLSLESCTIPHLNSTWVSAKNIKELTMEEMIMIDLIDNIDLIFPSTSLITIRQTTILRRLRWEYFRPFTQLTILAITDTEVKKLGIDFKNYVSSHLNLLSVVRARLKVLEDGALKGKTELKSINFQGNRIKVLKKSFFEDQKDKLSSVYFSFNPIEYIPVDLFDGMRSLYFVNFQGTQLKTLSWLLLHHGEYLNFIDNPLVCDCRMSWIPEKVHSFKHLFGRCEFPPNLKSRNLTDLTKSDFSACDSE